MNFTIRVLKIVIKILEYTQIKRVSYDRLENWIHYIICLSESIFV